MPVLTGWLLSFLSVAIGSYVIAKAFRSEGKGFFNVVLLSMVVRMIAVVVLLFALIYFLKIEKIPMAVSLFFFYFLFLIFEINFLSGANKNNNIN